METLEKVKENWHPVYGGGGTRKFRPKQGIVGTKVKAGQMLRHGKSKEIVTVVKDQGDRYCLCDVKMLDKPQMLAKSQLAHE